METLEIKIDKQIARVKLKRPERRNALNQKMIEEIIQAFEQLSDDIYCRVIVFEGEGKVFCSGADLKYMKEIASFGFKENLNDSLQLSRCFQQIYICKKPVIARVHGASIGGSNGLVAACDMAFCTHETLFSFAEVKLGIAPATISPFVIKKTGEAHARDLMLSGRKFYGEEAEKAGLINKSFPSENEMDEYIDYMIKQLLQGGPQAITETKMLISRVANAEFSQELFEYTAHVIAELRASREGQEGMNAFLEKRKPNWIF